MWYDNKCCDIVLKTCDMTTNVVISFLKTYDMIRQMLWYRSKNMWYDDKCCDIVLKTTCDMTTNVVISF